MAKKGDKWLRGILVASVWLDSYKCDKLGRPMAKRRRVAKRGGGCMLSGERWLRGNMGG